MSIPKVKLNNGVSIANALNGNNISLGFNEIYYQESSISGWYMGIENPQYTIYARSQVNPVQPNIWATSGTSDTEILNFINRTANVGGVPFTSTTEAFYFVGTRAENFIIKGNYPAITLKDLVLNYDTGTLMGYPWSGNTVYDLSPSQSNTTLSGSPTYNPLYNGILEFNGTNQYGYGPDLGQLSAFTVNTWFRLDSIPNPSEAPAIITEKFISNHLGFVIGFIDSPQNGDISGGFFNNGWYKTASFTPVLSTWYNVTLTYDNASLSLYIDGVLFDSVPVTEPAISSGLGYNVGKRWDSDDFINGQIQVVQIYNRALTDGEISNSYTRFVPRFIPPSATPTPTPENLTPTPTPTPTNTPTNTPTPTNTETPTNTPTPTNTETPTSTPTPTETETPTPTPTNTPTPSSTGSFDELINPIITNNDEYIEVGGSLYLMFAEPIGPTLTPTPTPTATETPTSTPTSTPTLTQTPTNTFTLTPTSTVTNTPQPTVTPTITNTPTFTPTPSTSPIPVTGYGYNLVALPYNFPSSGNSIMNAPAPQQTGTTLINELAVTGRGFYFNSLDNIGVNRTSYYSQFTGQSITITFTQNGDSAIYSGDSQSFKFWSTVGDTGFVFGTNIGVPPTNTPSGTAVLIQSATTTWVTGVTVYVSVQNSGPEVTPTQTATSVTPTPTPTSGATNDGWFFYTPEGQVMGAPTNNGNTIFLPPSGGSTFNPNYSGGTFNLFFNGFTSGGTSYVTQFQGLDTTGGTITITQNGVSVSYSGDSTQFSYAPSPNNYLQLQVTSYVQVISSGSTSFISGSPITLTFNGQPISTPTQTPSNTATPVTPTPTPTKTSSPTPTPTITPTNTETPTATPSQTPTGTPTPTITPSPTTPPSKIIVAAGGVNAIGYSYDGDNWFNSSNGSTFLSQPAFAVGASPSLFVAGGSPSTNPLIYSTDGDTWVGSSNGSSVFNSVRGVAFGGGKWVAVGISTSASAGIGYSLDGITWSASTFTGIFGSVVTSVAFNGSRWVATAQAGGGANPKNTIAYSDDGITWSASSNSTTIFTTSGRGVTWGGNKWVAVGDGTNRFAYSNDGITWSGSSSGNALMSALGNGVGFNGTQFVGCGQGTNQLIYSNDGITWSASTNGNTIFSLVSYCVTWDGEQWIAGGIGTNQLAKSSDGITWSTTTNGNTIMNNTVRALASKI